MTAVDVIVAWSLSALAGAAVAGAFHPSTPFILRYPLIGFAAFAAVIVWAEVEDAP